MSDSFGEDFNVSQSATGNHAVASAKRGEGIAPVFIKQLLQASGNTFTLWGLEFGMVSVVAIVRAIETSSIKITYTLEDHTGRIQAHYWLEDGDDAANFAADIKLNRYARVYGCLRSQKTLMILRLEPVNDPNVITTHALEVLNTRYSAEDFYKKSNECFGINAADSTAVNTNKPLDSNTNKLDSKQTAILNAICEHMKSDDGEDISRKDLQAKFRYLLTSELDSILDFLSSEGIIFSTIDNDHFQATD